jgi:hypothetical protein
MYKQHGPQGRAPAAAAGKQTSSSEVSGDISQQCRIGTGRQITIWRVHWNTGYAHVIWMVEAPGSQTICLGPMPNGLHTHPRFQRLFPPVFKMRLALLSLQWDPPTVLLWENGTMCDQSIQRANKARVIKGIIKSKNKLQKYLRVKECSTPHLSIIALSFPFL